MSMYKESQSSLQNFKRIFTCLNNTEFWKNTNLVILSIMDQILPRQENLHYSFVKRTESSICIRKFDIFRHYQFITICTKSNYKPSVMLMREESFGYENAIHKNRVERTRKAYCLPLNSLSQNLLQVNSWLFQVKAFFQTTGQSGNHHQKYKGPLNLSSLR